MSVLDEVCQLGLRKRQRKAVGGSGAAEERDSEEGRDDEVLGVEPAGIEDEEVGSGGQLEERAGEAEGLAVLQQEPVEEGAGAEQRGAPLGQAASETEGRLQE